MLLHIKKVALQRLLKHIKHKELESALQALMQLDDTALEDLVLNDKNFGDASGNINLALLSMLTANSAVDVETLLQGRTVCDEERLLDSSKIILKTMHLILQAVRHRERHDNHTSDEVDVMLLRIQILLQKNKADVFKNFWRDETTYTKVFGVILAKAFTQEKLLWPLSDVILVYPQLYRQVIGLKSNAQHIDKICDLAEKYVKIPKLHLWNAYDEVIAESDLTEEQIFDCCKDEICDILELNRVLLEREFGEEGGTQNIANFIAKMYQKISKDKGRQTMKRVETIITDPSTQISKIWKRAKPIVALFTDMHKDTLRKLFEENGREMLPQVLNHLMSAANCDDNTKMAIQAQVSKLSAFIVRSNDS